MTKRVYYRDESGIEQQVRPRDLPKAGHIMGTDGHSISWRIGREDGEITVRDPETRVTVRVAKRIQKCHVVAAIKEFIIAHDQVGSMQVEER